MTEISASRCILKAMIRHYMLNTNQFVANGEKGKRNELNSHQRTRTLEVEFVVGGSAPVTE